MITRVGHLSCSPWHSTNQRLFSFFHVIINLYSRCGTVIIIKSDNNFNFVSFPRVITKINPSCVSETVGLCVCVCVCC